MARLPVLHRRRSKREQAFDDLAKRWAKAWTIAKTSPHAARVAAKGAATYSAVRWGVGRKPPKKRLLVIPVVVAGVVVLRKARSSNNGSEADYERPLGPVATADAVSPPADAAAEAAAKAETTS